MIYDVYITVGNRGHELLVKAASKEEALRIASDLMLPKYGAVVSYDYASRNGQVLEYPGMPEDVWNACCKRSYEGGVEYVSSRELLVYILADGNRLAKFETRVPLMRLAGIAVKK